MHDLSDLRQLVIPSKDYFSADFPIQLLVFVNAKVEKK